MSFLSSEDVWTVFQQFYDEHGPVHHQLESYNTFVSSIQDIVSTNAVVRVSVDKQLYVIEFGDIYIDRPKHREINEIVKHITPKECIDRDITYQSNLFCDISLVTPLGTVKEFKKYHIGSIPVMVKSELCNLYEVGGDVEKLASIGECIYDVGGYFIIKGSKKVITCQKHQAYNQVHTYKNTKANSKFDYYSEIRSIAPTGSHGTKLVVGYIKNKGTISALLPYMDNALIPVPILFRALGAVDEREMVKYIFPDEISDEYKKLLIPSFERVYECDTEESALHFIGKKGKKYTGTDTQPTDEKSREDSISYAKHLISSELLPHLGTDEDSRIKKRVFLGYMIRKLLFVYEGIFPQDDRDHYANKRVHTVGMLLAQLFTSTFKRLRGEIVNLIEKGIQRDKIISISSFLKPATITSSLIGAISNNNWGNKKTPGISQQYEIFNYAGGIANARKTVTPVNTDGGKLKEPRKLKGTQWGVECPSETPEGKTCGLQSVLSQESLITCGSDPSVMREIILEMDVVPIADVLLSDDNILLYTKIFLNGDPFVLTKDPNTVAKQLRELRRKGGINPEVSIAYRENKKEIMIFTDAGRICRPLFIIEDGEILLKKEHVEEIRRGEWDDESGNGWWRLMNRGFIEIIDKSEEDDMLLITYPEDLLAKPVEERKKYTHCEFHPALILGIGASSIPFSNHNQSPRVTYQASMGKQSIGIPSANYRFQTRGKSYILQDPQIPICRTRLYEINGFKALPAGQNAVIAIAPYYAFGQEDSLIMHQAAIDRGFMNITVQIPYEGKIKPESDERFELPIMEECAEYRGNYKKLDPVTGIIREGEYVENGDVLIGITKKNNKEVSVHNHDRVDISIIYDSVIQGKVDYIQKGINGEGYPYVRVIVVQQRPPEYGDKFSALHGQKGTVGMIFKTHDMPYFEDGIVPDVILNPLAFPSRMTIGMLIESLTSTKVSSSSALHNISVKRALSLDTEHCEEDDTEMARVEYSSTKDDYYSTPFERSFSLDRILKEIRDLGVNGFSEGIMINGHTGESQNCLTFRGITYYQRLKHMVVEKIHARSRGGRTRLTRQPKEGRRHGGGLRIGYMEKDCMLAQGVPYFAKDRLMDQSDSSKMWFCKICGLLATFIPGDPTNKVPEVKECRLCNTTDVALVRIPYATKLMIQELAQANIIIRVLITTTKETGGYADIVGRRV